MTELLVSSSANMQTKAVSLLIGIYPEFFFAILSQKHIYEDKRESDRQDENGEQTDSKGVRNPENGSIHSTSGGSNIITEVLKYL